MPAWLYTVGSVFMRRANFMIPFWGLFKNLLVTITPCLVGLLISLCFPKFKHFVTRVAKPFTLITMISLLALVIYSKLYMFGLFELKYWFAGSRAHSYDFFCISVIIQNYYYLYSNSLKDQSYRGRATR